MNQSKDAHGYLQVRLYRRTITSHRLIAITFIPNPYNKHEVNHKNGVKNDNRVENLEWCTHKENMKHAHASGLIDFSKRRKGYKELTKSQVIEIKHLLDEGCSCKEIATLYDRGKRTIELIKNGTLHPNISRFH